MLHRGAMVVVVALSLLPLSAQQQPKAPPPPDLSNNNLSVSPSVTSAAGDPQQARIDGIQRRMQQEDRQRKLVADSQRLLALSGEIRDQVAKTATGSVSLELARKAAEAQKLARELERLSKE